LDFSNFVVSLIYQNDLTMIPAEIILQQLGGRRFIVMTGIKKYFHSNNGMTLLMHLTPNIAKAKFLAITLDASDTYTMVFSTIQKGELVELVRHERVYCDMLQGIFTKVTGLYTSLGTMGK